MVCLLMSYSSEFQLLFIPLYCCDHLRVLHSFPTRRSSDLRARDSVGRLDLGRGGDLEPAPLWAAHRMLRRCHRACDEDRKSTRLNCSHVSISYAGFCFTKA